MIILKHPVDLQTYLQANASQGVAIGFVPTMGALHDGHLALVAAASEAAQLVVCSIFVNPTQFNDPKDFEKYPHTLENDIYLLEKSRCDVLWLPAVADIYPNGTSRLPHFELGYLETILEGKYRPGHFQGVCQVVSRLLEVVKPGKLVLGQKDFQQCMVLKKMIELQGISTELLICPTKRETDGLAMSSRNLRLGEAARIKAPLIYQALSRIKQQAGSEPIDQLIQYAENFLSQNGFKVDYVAIAESRTLQPPADPASKNLVALAAAYLGDVRLIDNLLL